MKGRVFCLRGHRELIALDGDTGALDWSFSSPPGQINPNLLDRRRSDGPSGRQAQPVAGAPDRRRPAGHASGARGKRAARARCPCPSTKIRSCWSPTAGRSRRFDLDHGQTVWVYQESKRAAGQRAARGLLGDSERLLVLHDGRTLIRLDPATGSKRWSCLLGIEDLSERPGAMAYDDKRFYCVNIENIYGGIAAGAPGRLAGRRLAHLVVHLDRRRDDVVWSIALTAALRDRLSQRNNAPTRERQTVGRTMPVIVRRRETGALVQRFVFPTTIADVDVQGRSARRPGGDRAGPLGTGLEGGELIALVRPRALSDRTVAWRKARIAVDRKLH